MAVRREDLGRSERSCEGQIYDFPARVVRARAARGRMLAGRRRSGAAGVVVAVFLLAWLAGGVGSGPPRSRSGAPATVVLGSAQTLWDVADRYAPAGSDPRAYIDVIVRLNHLDGAPFAGERLRLPR